jgi:hypothetical protein
VPPAVDEINARAVIEAHGISAIDPLVAATAMFIWAVENCCSASRSWPAKALVTRVRAALDN